MLKASDEDAERDLEVGKIYEACEKVLGTDVDTTETVNSTPPPKEAVGITNETNAGVNSTQPPQKTLVRKRREIKSYKCKHCDYDAKNRKSNLKKHMMNKHGIGEVPVHPCPVCGDEMSYESLKDHIRHNGKSERNRDRKHRELDAEGHQEILAKIKELYGPKKQK